MPSAGARVHAGLKDEPPSRGEKRPRLGKDPPPDLLLQPEAIAFDHESMLSLVAVVHVGHLGEVIEPADDVRRPEALAGLDLLAVQLLDEADVAALMAP